MLFPDPELKQRYFAKLTVPLAERMGQCKYDNLSPVHGSLLHVTIDKGRRCTACPKM
jgi:hypothetical protein